MQILQVLRDEKLGPRGLRSKFGNPISGSQAEDNGAVHRKTSTGGSSASEDVGTDVEPIGLPAAQLPGKPSDLASQATNSNSQQMQVGLYS